MPDVVIRNKRFYNPVDFVFKKVYAEVPPCTEYGLTSTGKKAIEVITCLRNYGLQLMKEEGIDYDAKIKAEKENVGKK